MKYICVAKRKELVNVNGEKLGIDKVTLYFATEQTKIIEEAISKINLDEVETFGNEHKKGNAIYEVVRQWLMSKK